MKRPLSRLLIGSVVAVGLFAAQSSGAPPREIHRIYYYDAAHTQYAGERTTICHGNLFVDGVVTSYVEIWYEPCL